MQWTKTDCKGEQCYKAEKHSGEQKSKDQIMIDFNLTDAIKIYKKPALTPIRLSWDISSKYYRKILVGKLKVYKIMLTDVLYVASTVIVIMTSKLKPLT